MPFSSSSTNDQKYRRVPQIQQKLITACTVCGLQKLDVLNNLSERFLHLRCEWTLTFIYKRIHTS